MARKPSRNGQGTFPSLVFIVINKFCFPITPRPAAQLSSARARHRTGYHPLHLNSSAGISPQCHIPVSLLTHSSEFTPSLQSVLLRQAMFTRVSCGFDTLQKTDLIYALQNSSRSAHSKKAPAEPEPALTAEVARAPWASHTTHCLWESTEIHRIWICFEGFPGCQQKLPRHVCGFPQPCLPESPYT